MQTRMTFASIIVVVCLRGSQTGCWARSTHDKRGDELALDKVTWKTSYILGRLNIFFLKIQTFRSLVKSLIKMLDRKTNFLH